MEHLALEIFDLQGDGSKYAMLPKDASITISETSEIFASGDVWSYSFTLNIPANAHIFGTAGDIHGSRLHESINGRQARLWAEGLPLYLGYLKLDDDVDVDEEGNVDVSFESGQKTFEKKIEGGKANQVPMMGDVQIGMALWRKRWTNPVIRMSAEAVIDEVYYWWHSSLAGMVTENGSIDISCMADGENDNDTVQSYPRMVFPVGDFIDADTGVQEHVDKLNTDVPYTEDVNGNPTSPYCNVALCYQKYGYDKKDVAGNIYPEYNTEPEAQRGYEYMPANRVNSAPNFYVIYWIRALMKHLGIYVDENQMMDVGDLRRLFFVNTKCDIEEPKTFRTRSVTDSHFGSFLFAGGDAIPECFDLRPFINTENSKFEATRYVLSEPRIEGGEIPASEIPDVKGIKITLTGSGDWTQNQKAEYLNNNRHLYKAFATSKCFPDVDISEVIKAIENGFGIRFLFTNDFKRVRIVLLRNIFRSQEVQKIECDIISDSKTENNIRGFRLTYGDSEDTAFYYKGFADKLPHIKQLWPDLSDKHDYSQWALDAQYKDVIQKVTAFNKICYVTPNNGNAYVVKVDKDAKRYDELYPSLFGCADYMDAEDGDCTGEEETIKTIEMGFKPAIMNDLNMETERKAVLDKDRKQCFALFVEETMRPRRPDLKDLPARKSYNDADAIYSVDELWKKYGPAGTDGNMTGSDSMVAPGKFGFSSDTYMQRKGLAATVGLFIVKQNIPTWIWWGVDMDIAGNYNEGYFLYLQDNYEPNDDGVCPIETHDWGLTLGIMRGSGDDAYVRYEADPQDEEENDTWDIVPGSSISSHPDTCDNYGNEWDYNGEIRIYSGAQAIEQMPLLWPESNIDLLHSSGSTYRNAQTYILDAQLVGTTDNKGNRVSLLMAIMLGNGQLLYRGSLQEYAEKFKGKSREEMYAFDASDNGFGILVEVGSSYERIYTLLNLQWLAFVVVTRRQTPIVIDNGIDAREGRFSLKLRAEKPNPFYDASRGEETVRTREQAADAMTRIYTTTDTDLLNRPKVSGNTMRSMGWDFSGDYATAYSVSFSVRSSDNTMHEILWTPIREDGTVLSKMNLGRYITTFDGLPVSRFRQQDTQHLILDVDTTEQRAIDLHNLQAVYYAEEGEEPGSVTVNPQYLEISNENLRGRGLSDQFYKEYSYWVRNARVVSRKVHMTLAQLLAIDKTKKVIVGDITGFIRKIQYTISMDAGLGNVTLEIMYI